jgi:hypothetical protein
MTSYDYNDPEDIRAEAERVREQGRAAARAGKTCLGAGGYRGGDPRAHFWRQGYAEVNCAHPDLPVRYRSPASRYPRRDS